MMNLNTSELGHERVTTEIKLLDCTDARIRGKKLVHKITKM